MQFYSPIFLLASLVFLASSSSAAVKLCESTDDSVMPFRIPPYTLPARSCVWVSEDPANRCPMKHFADGNVYTHCPFTCKEYLPDDFDCDLNETNMHFPVLIPKNGVKVYRYKKCIWLARKDSKRCLARCSRAGITQACPLTCASCQTVAPSESPSSTVAPTLASMSPSTSPSM